MKKNEIKSLLKAKQKKNKKEIKESLTMRMLEVAEAYNLNSKKSAKRINKISKRLSKKLASNIRLDRQEIVSETEKAKERKEDDRRNEHMTFDTDEKEQLNLTRSGTKSTIDDTGPSPTTAATVKRRANKLNSSSNKPVNNGVPR
jgi:hypothetical protein